jgi:KaiC/GvpD/RAD55 family RecA-like ATPase
MANTNKKTCALDNDCDNNYVCAFDEKDMTHYCINNDINEIYYGCLDKNKVKELESIESNSNSEFKKCIDFSRRQVNKDGMEYNYMIFKPKKNVYVDTTTINIYLKCEEQILAIIPYNDYFILKCNENQEECNLESKDSLKNFIKKNSQNCIKKLYLEIIYECENEGLKKKKLINIDIDNFNKINIDLKCPVDIDSDKFRSKCASLYLDNKDMNNFKNIIDTNKNLYECSNPVYTLPRIVTNINNYKKKNAKNANMQLQDYDNKINEKIDDLKKLKAEKYIKLKEIQNGETITIEEAYNVINSIPLDRLLNNTKENWVLTPNLDAIENILNNDKYSNAINYHGMVYTIEDVIKIANESNQNFFVWYHNSYELENFASKLFFVDIFSIDSELLKKTNWVKHDNVTSGIFRFQLEHFSIIDEIYSDVDSYTESTGTIPNNLNDDDLKKLLASNIKNNILMNKYSELSENILSDNGISTNVINKLNNQITTFGQAIEMNNYEAKINDKILYILYIISALVFIIFIVVIVYYNNITAGKIKIFGQ